MNFLFWIAATVALIFTPAAVITFFSRERYRKRLKHIEILVATLTTQNEGYKKSADEMKSLRDQNSAYLEQKSIAVTELQELQKKVITVSNERDNHLREKEEATKARLEAEKKLELNLQKMEEAEKRMQDWELQRSESLKAAKASILEAGGQLSSKLLEDHKREAEAAKKEAETAVKKTSDALIEQVLNITKSVASIQDQNRKTEQMAQTVWRALASPAGAGSLAEVGLENSLKNFDLEPKRDYVMQYAIHSDEAGKLRPDAVIFLPQDMVMVIDSKASKFLLEIAEAEGNESETELLLRLKKTMNTHLNDLTSKNYAAAIRTLYKEAGRADKISHVLNVMYVPSENAINHIRRADPEFTQKAERAGIILASPSNLSGLLSLAKFNIGMMRQAENQEVIVNSVQELLDNVITVLAYSDKVGRGLKLANDYFDQFARSVNKRMLPKMRQLVSLGLKPNKIKEIPAKITSYDIRPSDDMMIIEGEVETVEAEIASA
ncbi:MAG TPA: DNA recombination protein RmuC [Rickettsiales bacterium]|nr:DNA recombination protein RmuC [Rickettsiales bacterium]